MKLFFRKLTEPPLYLWMVLSGAAALSYELVIQKLFTYLIGGSLISTTVVISCYMAGLSVGSLIGGRIGDGLRTRRSVLLTYASVELLIGTMGLTSLVAYQAGQSWLLALASRSDVAALYGSLPFRAGLASAALLPITTLMGATLPILARLLFIPGAHAETRRPSVALLYAGNLLGALFGTVVAAYVVVPFLGLVGAAAAAFACNACIATMALRRRRMRAVDALGLAAEAHEEAQVTTRMPPGSPLLLSFLSGLVLFSLEILWTHLLSAVIGSSVYAFSTMLVAVLFALFLAARVEARAAGAKIPLATLVFRGGLLLAISIPIIPLSSFVFGVVGVFRPDFLVREVARLAVALVLIVPVGLAVSQIFPRLLSECIASGRESRSIGRLTAVNTAGCLIGLLVARFVLIPYVGSSLSLRLIVFSLLLGAAWAARGRARDLVSGSASPGMVLMMIAALVGIVWPSWRPTWLLGGRNLYFTVSSNGDYHQPLFQAEDPEGGFVTVHRTGDGQLELRTNGKFEGNSNWEMLAQLSFGYLPSLAAAKTDRAFLIGLGTGTTLKGLCDFPFQRIDVAERSLPMVTAARTYFADTTGDVLDDPRVHLIHDDGRNALLLADGKYDVVTIEITSIWFAGAANLYSRDFYRTVRAKLESGGVMQQWVQMHHMRLIDLFILVNTVRSVFPHAALWLSGNQGQLLASDRPIQLDWGRIRNSLKGQSRGLKMPPAELYTVVGSVLADEEGVNRFVVSGASSGFAARFRKLLTSSDLWPYLEYATPKGNAIYNADELNIRYLQEEMSPARKLPLRNVPAADRPFARAVAAFGARDCASAQRLRASLSPSDASELAFFGQCVPRLSLTIDGEASPSP